MAKQMTKEKLIKLFKFEAKEGGPYYLRYRWRMQYHKEDKPLLQQLIKEGLVKVVEKDIKSILYQYTGA